MMGRPKDAEIQGYYCPLQRLDLLQKRMVRGSCIRTDLGYEKRCPRCAQFWPMDTEFWFASKTEDGLFAWCRDCYTTQRWPDRGAPHFAPAPLLLEHVLT